jgi:hypothetical protein
MHIRHQLNDVHLRTNNVQRLASLHLQYTQGTRPQRWSAYYSLALQLTSLCRLKGERASICILRKIATAFYARDTATQTVSF